MRAMRLSAGLGLLLAAAGCGPSHTMQQIEERPLDQATALDVIEEALGSRQVQAERFVEVTLPNRQTWKVDVAGRNMAVAVEYLTAQDRELVGDAMPIQASPDETPRVIQVQRAGVEGPAGRLYLRVFTDQHFRYQPNPPADLPEAPYTIREAQARLRRDVTDFAAWFVANHGSGSGPQ